MIKAIDQIIRSIRMIVTAISTKIRGLITVMMTFIKREPTTPRLSEDALIWQGAFTKLIEELCPGEVFAIVVSEDSNGAQYYLKTESPRVIVAWSEVQAAVAEISAAAKKANEINDLRSQ